MKIFNVVLFLFFLVSCSNIEFVYNENKNLTNPVYEKTSTSISGLDIPFLKPYIRMFFGDNKEKEYHLKINIIENRIKTSVEKNQAASNIKHELRFFYSLQSNRKECKTYEKEVVSSFTITPKSSGYDYGTDASLEKNYELAVTENLNSFVSFLSAADINNCL